LAGDRDLPYLLRVGDRRDRTRAGGERRTDDELHLLAEDQILGLALGDVGLGAVVFDQDLERAAFDAAVLVDGLLGELDPAALGQAEARARPGQRQHRADLDRLAGRRLRRDETGQRREPHGNRQRGKRTDDRANARPPARCLHTSSSVGNAPRYVDCCRTLV
jgi:hypothetical protein